MQFKKIKVKSLQTGKAKFVYKEITLEDRRFVINADVTGVEIVGESKKITNQQDLSDFAKVLGDAFNQYLKCKPNLKLNLSGH